MKILMMTNTYTPHVGGVARSVQGFADAFRMQGHEVLIAAPWFRGAPPNEPGVVRCPAVRDFNGSPFSVPLPQALRQMSALRRFQPEVVHSHHPFLLGGTALRVAAARGLPVVFTHHTIYEQYTHYVPGDSPALKRFVIDVVSGYCNLCDAVIAPSAGVAALLQERGVVAPICVIPSGVDTRLFMSGDGAGFRRRRGIPASAFVVGHVGRLETEKNLGFLCRAVIRFLHEHADGLFLVVGDGTLKDAIRASFEDAGIGHRLVCTAVLEGAELHAAYRAMDVFAFASQTETQGMVVTEAMAAGVPVVALEALGIRDVLIDGGNGRLVKREDVEQYATALKGIAKLPAEARSAMQEEARASAARFDMTLMSTRTIELYQDLIGTTPVSRRREAPVWAAAFRRLRRELRMIQNIVQAAGDTVRPRVVWEVGPTTTSGATPAVPAAADPPAGSHSPMREAGRASFKARLLGWLWAALLRLQCASWRKRCEGLERLDAVLNRGERVLFCFWHGKYLPLFALLRGRPACVFTTESARGRVIAAICRRFGYHCVLVPVTGRSHGYELMRRALANERNGGIAVDGPLGPYHRVKRGAVKLASDLGYLIVPASATARRKRVLKYRWDRLELPALCTRVGLAIGEPIAVPSELGPGELQIRVAELGAALEALDRRAAELAGVPPPRAASGVPRRARLADARD